MRKRDIEPGSMIDREFTRKYGKDWREKADWGAGYPDLRRVPKVGSLVRRGVFKSPTTGKKLKYTPASQRGESYQRYLTKLRRMGKWRRKVRKR